MMPGTDSRSETSNKVHRQQPVSSSEYPEMLLDDSLQAALRAQIAEQDRRLAERERRIAELEARNAELEGYAYTVSHDLKAPLVTIKGFMSFLRRDVRAGEQERVEHDLDRISYAADRMQCLLDGLLELSRVGRVGTAAQQVAFGEVVAEAVGRLAGTIEKSQGRVLVAPSLPTVYGDRALFVDAVEKLLDNAIQHAGEGKTPCIEVGVREPEDSAAVGSENPVLFVRDNGPGIDPRHHERVFQLFERLDPEASEGTGVGLTLVKRIVELHKGKIWIESSSEGSTMCFTLPCVDP